MTRSVQLGSAEQRLNYLLQATKQLSKVENITDLVSVIRRCCKEISGADVSVFVLREKEKYFYTDEMIDASEWNGDYFPIDTYLSGIAIKQKKAVVVDDILNDNQLPSCLHRPTSFRSVVMVPVPLTEPVGAVSMYFNLPSKITPEQIKMLESLADFSGSILETLKRENLLRKENSAQIKALEEATRSLDTFSHTISHDLRTPLRSLAGLMSLFYQSAFATTQGEDLELIGRISSSIANMEKLINGLLEFSKSGQKPIEKHHVSMNEIVFSLWSEYKQQEVNRSIDFRIGPLPDAYADPVLIRQVWANLIENALKYTRKRKVSKIEIGFDVSEGNIVYYIKDNGAGFDMTRSENLFGVFQRFHQQEDFEGTGIGLSLVKRIISRHGGTVSASSKVGHGATFYFTLPN